MTRRLVWVVAVSGLANGVAAASADIQHSTENYAPDFLTPLQLLASTVANTSSPGSGWSWLWQGTVVAGIGAVLGLAVHQGHRWWKKRRNPRPTGQMDMESPIWASKKWLGVNADLAFSRVAGQRNLYEIQGHRDGKVEFEVKEYDQANTWQGSYRCSEQGWKCELRITRTEGNFLRLDVFRDSGVEQLLFTSDETKSYVGKKVQAKLGSGMNAIKLSRK